MSSRVTRRSQATDGRCADAPAGAALTVEGLANGLAVLRPALTARPSSRRLLPLVQGEGSAANR